MSRKLFSAVLLVVVLSTVFAQSALAQGPVYCRPNDTWCQWQQAAQQRAQQAQQRLSRDWNNIGSDAFGYQNAQRFQQGVQGFQNAAQRGFFNCTSWRQDVRGNLYCAQ